MEGCSHLKSCKKYKQKYTSIISYDGPLKCSTCAAQFNVHVCMECGKMFCFSEHLNHACSRNYKPVNIIAGQLTNGITTVNQAVGTKKTEDNHKDDLSCKAPTMLLNKRYGYIYCILCKKYLRFNRLIETFINHKYNIKNQKEYIRMHCAYLKGTVNLGNTCYINSLLQVFFNTATIKKCFFDTTHERVLCSKQKCIICVIKNMYIECYNLYTLVVPNEFIFVLWSLLPAKYNSNQFDVHEFFHDLCELLHTNLHTEQNHNNSRDMINSNTCKCVVHRVFYGVLSSMLKCTGCGNESTKMEDFYSLSLGIYGKKSVDDALRYFFKWENLNEIIYCQNCSKSERFIREMAMSMMPTVLVLHLKRFMISNNSFEKDNSALPPSYFINCDMLNNTSGMSYKLFGMICHAGTLDYGHYYTIMRIDHAWMKFDDDKVQNINIDCISASLPYILFYELEQPI